MTKQVKPTSWTVFGVARAAAGSAFLFFLMLLVEENGRNFIQKRHLDELWSAGASMLNTLPDLSFVTESHWFWFIFGGSFGLAAALWIVRLWPEGSRKGEATPPLGVPPAISITDYVSAASPLRLVYSDTDPRFVPNARQGYQVGVLNTSSRTIDNVRVTVDDSPLMSMVKGRPGGPSPNSVSIDPGEMKYFPIFPGSHDQMRLLRPGRSVLGIAHTFKVWASGRDAGEVRLSLDYIPGRSPLIVRHQED